MYLRRAVSALISLGRANTLPLKSLTPAAREGEKRANRAPRPHFAVARNMSSGNPTFSQQQPPSEEEVVFTGRARRKRQQRSERMAYQSSIPDSRLPLPPPPRAGSSGSGGGSRSGGGVTLPPRPRTPEAWSSSYRADSRGGRHGDTGRTGQGWYEDFGGDRSRNDAYRGASGYGNAGYRNAEPARGVRNPQADFYNHPNTSGGVALRNQFDGVYSVSSRGDQYYIPSPPYREYSSSHHPGAHLERTHPAPPRGPRSHPAGLPQRPVADPPYRSDHRQPPYPSRGPLSSSRFSQGIDKHSRYSPPPTADKIDNHPPKPSKRSRKRTSARPPPSTSPPPPPIPPSESPLESPIPTPLYLATSLLPSPRLPTPTHQLIILDLNGTLLAREKGRARCGSLNPTPRPGLTQFLTYLFARFSVMVWSSAQPENVRLMVHALFTETQKQALLARWARDTLGLTKVQFSQKTQVYKRLERVWDGEYKVGGGQWDQTNTVLLDDTAVKAKGQPWNHVEVEEFLGTKAQRREDRTLVALVGYLEECRWRANVSAFIRSTRFETGGVWEARGEEVLRELELEGGEVADQVVGEALKEIAAGEMGVEVGVEVEVKGLEVEGEGEVEEDEERVGGVGL